MPNHRLPVPAGYLLLDDAAGLYGVSRPTINRWITDAGIQRYTHRGDTRTLVKMSELRAKLPKILPRHPTASEKG